ncbi:hypothetical protein [Spirillospora sp. CA-128828]|uniref:hypothetical protein n=1 Tax=Spirillospora sp. CA-128828 TaxID=3240033 RepID=UPI003D8E353B
MMIVLRHRPRPLPSSSSSSVVLPQAIGWDGLRELHVAICKQCIRSFASSDAAKVDAWTDAHSCGGEQDGLPDEIPGRAA